MGRSCQHDWKLFLYVLKIQGSSRSCSVIYREQWASRSFSRGRRTDGNNVWCSDLCDPLAWNYTLFCLSVAKKARNQEAGRLIVGENDLNLSNHHLQKHNGMKLSCCCKIKVARHFGFLMYPEWSEHKWTVLRTEEEEGEGEEEEGEEEEEEI